MLGIEASQATVSRYMIRRRGPPSQSWRTFLRNQASELACVDLFTVVHSEYLVCTVSVGFFDAWPEVAPRRNQRRFVQMPGREPTGDRLSLLIPCYFFVENPQSQIPTGIARQDPDQTGNFEKFPCIFPCYRVIIGDGFA